MNDRDERPFRRESFLLPLALIPFVILCTLNSATYRYGASDQAFYVPAIVLDMHPDYFPHDASLIRAQARLTFVDETIGGLASLTGIRLPVLLGTLYTGALLLLAVSAWLIARRFYSNTWSGIALLAALTLRHSISRTGTNTLEGYFHPRQLAFGFAVLALAMVLRRRWLPATAALIIAGAIHPTTAMWFGVWLAVAAAVIEPRWRVWIAGAVVAAGSVGAWALTVGPLAGRLIVMDPEWLATLETKSYLFPTQWPVAIWIANLAYVPVIIAIYRWRRTLGRIDRVETGIVTGALVLVVLFAAILPFNAAHVALAVQLQPARMFWMLDLLATIYLVWALAEAPRPTPQRARMAAAILVCLSVLRGGYVGFVEFPQRRIAQLDITDDDWSRAMAWVRTTNVHSGWLADPIHAVRYGTSLRVAGERDVMVEAIKDAAIGMYDRRIAIRTRDRLAAIGDFSTLTPERARRLGATYDLDYLIADRTFDLPLAFQSGQLLIYRLR